MPITPDNYQRAVDALISAQDDPNSDPAQVSQLEAKLKEYEDANRPAEPAQAQPSKPLKEETYYDPALAYVKHRLEDPAVTKQLNLPNVFPDAIRDFGEDSDPVKAYREYEWQQAQQKAAQEGKKLNRYSDIKLTEHPIDKTIGAVNKYGPAVFGAINRSLFNIPGRAIDAANSVIAPSQPSTADVEEIAQRNVSPGAQIGLDFAAQLNPKTPINMVAHGVMGAANYAAQNPFVKTGIGALVGGLGSAADQFIRGEVDNPHMPNAQDWENAKQSAAYGAPLGAAGDVVAQTAGKARRLLTESPKWNDVRAVERAGGNTHVLGGVTAPEAVKTNINEALQAPETTFAGDVAARKVAPAIQESLGNQARNQYQQINQEIEAYKNSPEGKQEKSTRPVLDALINLSSEGTYNSPVMNELRKANPDMMPAIKDMFHRSTDVSQMTPQEADEFLKHNDGVQLDPKQAELLGVQSEQGKVPVAVPAKMNAGAVLDLEQMIDDRLKMATTPGGVNNPAWKAINKAVKSVRDQFEYYPAGRGETPPSAPPSSTGEPTEPPPAPRGANVAGTVPPVPPNVPSVGAEGTSAAPPSQQQPFSTVGGNRLQLLPQSTDELLASSEPPPVAQNPFNPGRVQISAEMARSLTPPTVPPGAASETQSIIDSGQSLPPATPSAVMEAAAQTPRKLYQPNMGKPASRGWQQTEDEAADYLNQHNYQGAMDAVKLDNAIAADLAQGEFKDAVPQWQPSGKKEQLLREYREPKPEQVAKTEAAQPAKVESPAARADTVAASSAADEISPSEAKSFVDIADLAPEPERTKSAVPAAPQSQGKSAQVLQKVGQLAQENASKNGHIMKAQIIHGGILGGDYEVDQLVKRGLMEQVPTAEKKYAGMPDHEYRLTPKGQEQVDAINKVKGIQSRRNREEGAISFGGKKPEAQPEVKTPEPTGPKPGEQLTATLEDGTVVKGLSALRHRQHEALTALEEAQSATGSNSKENIHKKVLNYGARAGQPYTDEALMNEAKKIGKEQDLRDVAATVAYQRLKDASEARVGGGTWARAGNFLGFRLDPALAALSGQPHNPFFPNAGATSISGKIGQYLAELANQRAGIGAARLGDDAQKIGALLAPYLNQDQRENQ